MLPYAQPQRTHQQAPACCVVTLGRTASSWAVRSFRSSNSCSSAFTLACVVTNVIQSVIMGHSVELHICHHARGEQHSRTAATRQCRGCGLLLQAHLYALDVPDEDVLDAVCRAHTSCASEASVVDDDQEKLKAVCTHLQHESTPAAATQLLFGKMPGS